MWDIHREGPWEQRLSVHKAKYLATWVFLVRLGGHLVKEPYTQAQAGSTSVFPGLYKVDTILREKTVGGRKKKWEWGGVEIDFIKIHCMHVWILKQ